jgi:hypothetical protein
MKPRKNVIYNNRTINHNYILQINNFNNTKYEGNINNLLNI